MRVMFVVALAVAGAVASAVAANAADADAVKARLLSVADSPRYYWAWTYPWLNHGGWMGDMRNVVEKDGDFMPKQIDEVRLECEYQKCADGRSVVTTGVDSDQLVAAAAATEKILNHMIHGTNNG